MARYSAFFFVSSRRRHTRLQGDWSSDVCSSDLPPAYEPNEVLRTRGARNVPKVRRTVTKDARTAVVLMAYGSPERAADIPAYFSDIRGGRPVRPEAVAEPPARYPRIGGSPLDEITEAQRAALERELGLPVFVGMKHWQPRIAEAAERAVAGGAERL